MKDYTIDKHWSWDPPELDIYVEKKDPNHFLSFNLTSNMVNITSLKLDICMPLEKLEALIAEYKEVVNKQNKSTPTTMTVDPDTNNPSRLEELELVNPDDNNPGEKDKNTKENNDQETN